MRICDGFLPPRPCFHNNTYFDRHEETAVRSSIFASSEFNDEPVSKTN
jgi:hypothetical protein